MSTIFFPGQTSDVVSDEFGSVRDLFRPTSDTVITRSAPPTSPQRRVSAPVIDRTNPQPSRSGPPQRTAPATARRRGPTPPAPEPASEPAFQPDTLSSLAGGNISVYQLPGTGRSFLGDPSSVFDYPHPSSPGYTVRGSMFMGANGVGGSTGPPPTTPPTPTPEEPPPVGPPPVGPPSGDPGGGAPFPVSGGTRGFGDRTGAPRSFDDPHTSLLEDFLNFRINELLDPVTDPRREQLMTDLDERMDQLRQPPFTAGQESALRTQSQDEIERQRAATQRQALERISARGFAPTSGLAEQAAQDIDEFYGGQRATESADFGQAAISEQQRRLDQAIELANALSLVEAQARQEEETRRQRILELVTLGAELPERRLQLALSTLGQAPPPGSMFQSVAALGQLTNQQQNLALQAESLRNQSQSQFGAGLASIYPWLFGNPQQGGGGSSQPLLPSTPFTGMLNQAPGIGISSFI